MAKYVKSYCKRCSLKEYSVGSQQVRLIVNEQGKTELRCRPCCEVTTQWTEPTEEQKRELGHS